VDTAFEQKGGKDNDLSHIKMLYPESASFLLGIKFLVELTHNNSRAKRNHTREFNGLVRFVRQALIATSVCFA